MSHTPKELGFRESFDRQRLDLNVEMNRVGRVTTAIGNHVRVEVPDVGPVEAMLASHGSYPPRIDRPVVGDWVVLSHDGGIVESVFERQTLVKRQRPGKRVSTQPVAANVDLVAIVTSANRDFNIRRIERYLTVVYDSGATPVVVVNKADLADAPERFGREAAAVAPGVKVLVVSALEGALDGLRELLEPGVSIAFVGSSGVGKSTLINGLLGEERLETADIRTEDDKGRHTTTRRELIVLETGGLLVDTPGMREIQLAATDEALDLAFEDIRTFAEGCKFRDCTHQDEPDCAVLEALAAGELEEDRLRNYLRMSAEISDRDRKREEASSSEEKKRFKEMKKTMRRYRKNRTKN